MFVAIIFSEGFNKSMGFTTFTSYFSPSLYLAEQTKYIEYYRESARLFYLTNKIFVQSSLLLVVTILFGFTLSADAEGYKNGAWLQIPPPDNLTWNVDCKACIPTSVVNYTCIKSCKSLHISFEDNNVSLEEDLIKTLVNTTNDFIVSQCIKMCPEEVQNEESEMCSQSFSQPIFLPTETFVTILFPLLIYLYLMSMLDCAQLHYNTGFSNFFLFGVKDDIDEDEDNKADASKQKVENELSTENNETFLEQIKQLKEELDEVRSEAEDLKDEIKNKDARIRIHIKETNDMRSARIEEKEEMEMILKQYRKAEDDIKNLLDENKKIKDTSN